MVRISRETYIRIEGDRGKLWLSKRVLRGVDNICVVGKGETRSKLMKESDSVDGNRRNPLA